MKIVIKLKREKVFTLDFYLKRVISYRLNPGFPIKNIDNL